MRLRRPGWAVVLLVTFAFAQNAGGAYASLTFYLAATTLLIMLLWSILLRWGITVEVQGPTGERHVGDELVVHIRLRNRTPLPAPWLLVGDGTGPAGQPPEQHLSWLAPFGQRRFERHIPCERRGRYQVGPVELELTDPLGLFIVRRRVTAAASLTVYPRPVPMANPPLVAAAVGARRHAPALQQHRAALAGVRPIAPGDSPRDIHWKVTARRGHYYVKQFDPGSSSLLRIVVDLNRAVHRRARSRHSDELAVAAALGLGRAALRAGQAVELWASSAAGLHVGRGSGRVQYARLREALALVPTDGEQPLSQWLTTLAQHLERRAPIVAVTPDLSPATVAQLIRMRRSGHEVVLVDPLPEPDAAPALGRVRLLEALRRAGVVYLPIRANGGWSVLHPASPRGLRSAWPDVRTGVKGL